MHKMSNIKELSLIQIESRDRWLRKLFQKLGLKTFDINSFIFSDQSTDDDLNGDQYLKSLDPKNWKNQDHYAVLGLKNKRFYATDEQIKKAYRSKVLTHHPDKRQRQPEDSNIAIDLDHDYFYCIIKAYEYLGDSVKRRSYDSVDHTFNDDIPTVNAYSKAHFFEVFHIVFHLNSRWSNIKPVPNLGNESSNIAYVNSFYNFWYNFDSWREYSYLDEEQKEKGENREERRWMEKQNRAARAQRKKEEMQRIRQLVDNAYQCDPRIIKFKEEEKQRKTDQKRIKQEMIRAKQLEDEKQRQETEERERLLKQQKEEEIRAKKDEERKLKEAFKKQLRKERKHIEALFEKYNYFSENEKQKLENLQEFDKICRIYTFEELTKFRETFEHFNNDDAKRDFFLKEVENLNNRLEKERISSITQNSSLNGNSSDNLNTRKKWSYDDVQLLIKAVKLFPAGTKDRWAVVTKFINDKSSNSFTRNHRDVLEKAKELQSSDKSLKEEANKNAFKTLEESRPNINNCDESVPSQRFDAPSSYVSLNDQPWNNEEQQLLEQAMKTFPNSLGTERWDRIAECIPNRSRTDCIKRYKYLVDLVKSKNSAKSVIHKSKK